MIVNQAVANLEAVELGPKGVLFLDADSCSFPFGEAEPYGDALDLRSQVDYIALVTANPNTALNQARAKRLDVDDVVQPPRRPVWVKSSLYAQAATRASERTAFTEAAVIDDRWFAGVAAARLSIHQAVGVMPRGIWIKRERWAFDTPIDKYVLRPVEAIGRLGACALGVDGLIRPRA